MAWEELLDRDMAQQLPGMEVLREEPMRRHTSFRVGGPAKRMAFPRTGGEMVLLHELARKHGARPLVIGNGTNLLCPDKGLDRLVICTEAMNAVEAGREEHTMTVQAGASLRKAAEYACRAGLAGLEFAHGIPGTLGGGVCMNAGAYGGEMTQVLVSADVLLPGGNVKTLGAEDLHPGYRHSLLMEMPDAVVLSAVVRLNPGVETEIRGRMRDLMDRRRKSQPLEYPSAGSAFKRPAGHYAGGLIDQCGLKGLSMGGAQVSEKHAGFLINRGGATFADVTGLIREVQRRVLDQTGVMLEPEIRILWEQDSGADA
ncbi:MAG: UDP-N-acetylmuramate dehydrogenase [Oscillibacter sp.]|nr:UDP-N-acetylmuramate dehydrogenase [Oscillibacter sp.]